MLDPLKPGHQMLVPNHRHNFLKQMKYVQEGLLSDPPGMDMYLVVGIIRKRAFSCYARCGILQTSRDTSCTTPAPSIRRQKAASGRYLHVRTNLFDFAWSLKAAAAAGRMKDIGRS